MEEVNKVIVLEQKPIISYDLVEAKGKEVAERIEALDLDSIEPTEANIKVLKNARTELKKEFEVFENQRKMVKDMVMKPYNDFDAAYKEHISTLFKDADTKLKNKVGAVDDEILSLKIENVKAYFGEKNTHDFLKYEDLNQKVIKSITDKKLHAEIDEYLLSVKSALEMIDTLDNRDRISVKYQMHKDLNRAISEAQIEVKREKEIKEKKEAQEKAEKEKEERLAKEQEDLNARQKSTPGATVGDERVGFGERPPIEEFEKMFEQPQLRKTTFTVTATIGELKELRQYMNDKGLSYE